MNLGIVHFLLLSFVLRQDMLLHEVDFWGVGGWGVRGRGCLKSYVHENKKKTTVSTCNAMVKRNVHKTVFFGLKLPCAPIEFIFSYVLSHIM